MFKLNFLKMRTESALKKSKNHRASIPYEQAQRVGIIFSVEDKQKHEDIKEFAKLLEQDGKKVEILEYLPVNKENYEFRFDFFTIKDLSFWGQINSEHFNKFCDTPFDYLYYVDMESNPLVLHLLAKSKAHCRIGKFKEDDSPFFELMIEQNGSNKGLIETMYKYTKQLR